MKWCISAFAVFGVIVLVRCQDIGQLKLGILEEIVQISRNLESSIQEVKADMTSLKADMTSLKADMAYKFEELEKDVSSKQDLLMKEMIFIKKVHEKESQQPEESSNLDVLYQTFADIFKAEMEFQDNILKFSCSRHQVETLQNLLATDECLDGTHNCSSSAECKDNIVGFKCVCREGYEGDGFSCEDVDECSQGLHQCDQIAQCTNEDGNYTCNCASGYTGDGFNCQDVDECTQGLHQCDQVAQCNNEDGNYTCSCPNGYTGDGFNCQDIDECSNAENPCDVNAVCSNNDGHYTCSCKYSYIGNGTSCDSCKSPSQIIDGLGCVIPVMTKMGQDQAQANCKSLGGKLLEGISSQSQLDQLKTHFHLPMRDIHVGIQELRWIEGGESIDPKSPLWRRGFPIKKDRKCGMVCLHCSRPSLFYYPCSFLAYSFCEMK